jgi:hypothetical protein
MATATVRDSSSCSFWFDTWFDMPLFERFPELFPPFVRDQLLLDQNVYQSLDFFDLFHLTLSDEAFAQSHELSDIIEVTDIQARNDLWSYIWGSIQFASNGAYSHMSGVRQVHPVYSWLWKSSCQPKPKVFFRLLLKDRLNTRELLKRKNMALEYYSCVLCHQAPEESLLHLFLHCPFALACWNILLQVTFFKLYPSSRINFGCLSSWKS